MSGALPIATGDPRLGAASSTRFLLPFGFRLEELAQPAGGRRFVELAPTDAYSRQYLTFETAEVLYSRAIWLELRWPDATPEAKGLAVRDRFEVDLGEGRRIPVVQTARLVLFEAVASEEPDELRSGFLIVEIGFPEPGASLADLAAVNELFRYWLRPFQDHPERRPYLLALAGAPQEVTPRGQVDPYLDRWEHLLGLPCQLADGRTVRCVCDEDRALARRWADTGRGPSGWIVYSDPRSYVWTCAVVPGGGAALAGSEAEAAAESRTWIGLLNVDPPASGGPSNFERSWARERTYGRWAEAGSLYGFTTHSAAALLPPWSEPPLWRHFGGSYFDQTLLLLYVRVTLFRFSRALAVVSAAARGRAAGLRDQALETELARIRKSLTLFTNLYQYPLLSNQQQGLELYELAHRAMDIRDLAGEVRAQIAGSHDLLSLLADQDEALSARRLNVVAASGLALALATGFLGMNILAERLPAWNLLPSGWLPDWFPRPTAPGSREWLTLIGVTGVFMIVITVFARTWRTLEKLLFRPGPPSRRKAPR